MLQLCCNYFQLNWSLPPNIALGGVGGGGLERHQPPIANFGFKTTGINCATIGFNCADIFLIYNRPFFRLLGRWFSDLSPLPPLRISDSKQRESIVLQLCSIELQFFRIAPTSFFSYQRDSSWNSLPPCPPSIVNFGFGTAGINCAPIMLNRPAMFLNCSGLFIPVTWRGGGWLSELSPSHI